MKSGRKYLTIRKFSELTHTTVDTLKHYDEIGLLTPAYIGENKYRYYLPEQSLILTRILFGKHAGIPLKEIRSFIHSGHHTDAIQKYNEIINDLRTRGKETEAIVSTIDNLRYYYSLSEKHPPRTLFSLYLPEWFILFSEKSKIDAAHESSSSDIANNLFLEGFNGQKWPHYLLGALLPEENIKTRNFSETKYFLKIDTPQLYDKAKIRFVPNGEWLCMLFYSKGKGLSENLGFYMDTLEKEKISVSGDIFIMDVVNSLITSNPDNYCTMIYALKERQTHEQF